MVRTIERATLALRRDVTLGTLMDRLEKVHGDRLLVTEADGGLELTYAQAAKRVRRWSGGVAAKAKPGEVVVIATPNGYEQLLLCFAVARAGCIPAPVNDQMRKEEVDHVVRDSGAVLTLRSAVAVDGGEPLADAHPAEPGDVAALFYTSGTTGKPKGAALTHRSLVGQAASAALAPSWLIAGEAVLALPVAHIFGFAALVGMAAAGVRTYLLPRFNPVKVLDAIEQRKATLFMGVPAMYRMLDEAGAEQRDLRSVRVWGSGADAMPVELAQRFKKMGASITLPFVGPVGEAVFAEGYGMVEVGGGVAGKISLPYLGRGGGDGSLGMALPGYDLRVVGDDGVEVASGQIGELQVRGPGVLESYWGDAAATAAVRTDDGWLRTGDLARKGRFGMIAFEGRAKHVIKHGGYSVYALEVEKALEQHPAVLEAAVVGLPDERLGEVPAAVVRLAQGTDLESADLAGFAAKSLSDYKVPKRFIAVDELPRTGTEKVQKNELLALFG
ncbi:MAG: AMP-binding protein [Actinomycetota bacterium]|nr:AMP-binding protein [Actinomycetota bacterium]